MITTMDQAKAVQFRRAQSGKRGYAKAVRRFLRRLYPENYRLARGQLNVTFKVQEKEEDNE